MVKIYLKSYGYLFGLIVILSILLSIINYFINIPISVIKIIIPILSLFISSIILGRDVKKKGYIEGIKFSLIYLVLITILKLIFNSSFNLKVIIMYAIFIFTSILGAMIGINTKK